MIPHNPATARIITRNRIENAIIKESLHDLDGAWRELQTAVSGDPESKIAQAELQAFLQRYPQYRPSGSSHRLPSP